MTNINLISKDTDLSKLKIRPLDWDVVINDRRYYVVRLEGFVHSIGGIWGENNLWAYPRDEVPCYGNLIEFSCDRPVIWGIVHEPKNYTKCKWDECEARTGCSTYITRNGKKFCDVVGGIERAQVMIFDLEDHPMEFGSIDFDKKVIGRKVWWRSEPAVVTYYCDGQASVILEPDGIESFTTPAEFRKEDSENYYEDGNVKASVLDKHIWWFRE